MSPQQHDPNPEYIRVPISTIKVGDTILWFGIACIVEEIIPVDPERSSIVASYKRIQTATFDNAQQIHVAKREKGSEQTHEPC